MQSLETRRLLAGDLNSIGLLPEGEDAPPSFQEVGAQTVLIDSPLHVPIDASDPDGGPLTVTVSVEHPNLLEAVVLSGNRSIRIEVDGFGDMVFELFEQRAPRPSGRVIELAESGFYDGLLFHRVDNGFVLQGGDPEGTGRGGSELDDFDDQFHRELQHNRSGVLSFAKTTDDTNNSQFFITETETRFLDFNHSIFGQLVEGEDVREAISEVEVTPPPQTGDDPPADRPIVPVVMTKVTVFDDIENSVVMLKSVGNQSGTTNVTVRVADEEGNFSEQTIEVAIAPDVANSQPFLDDFEVPTEVFVNSTFQLQLDGIDIENDAVGYDAFFTDSVINAGGAIDRATGLLTIDPNTDFVGELGLGVCVFPAGGNCGPTSSTFDRQSFKLNVVSPAFHRLGSATDVNGDGRLTSSDAFAVINALGRSGDTIVLGSAAAESLDPNLQVNVVPDNRISALDALFLVNELVRNSLDSGGDAERVFGSQSVSALNHADVLRFFDWRSDDKKEDPRNLAGPIRF